MALETNYTVNIKYISNYNKNDFKYRNSEDKNFASSHNILRNEYWFIKFNCSHLFVEPKSMGKKLIVEPIEPRVYWVFF